MRRTSGSPAKTGGVVVNKILLAMPCSSSLEFELPRWHDQYLSNQSCAIRALGNISSLYPPQKSSFFPNQKAISFPLCDHFLLVFRVSAGKPMHWCFFQGHGFTDLNWQDDGMSSLRFQAHHND